MRLKDIISVVSEAQPLTPEKAAERARVARREFTYHGHDLIHTLPEWERKMTYDNCAACVLNAAKNDRTKDDRPNHCVWLAYWVESRKAVPRAWLDAELQEYVKGENNSYFVNTVFPAMKTYGLTTYEAGAKLTISFH